MARVLWPVVDSAYGCKKENPKEADEIKERRESEGGGAEEAG